MAGLLLIVEPLLITTKVARRERPVPRRCRHVLPLKMVYCGGRGSTLG
jgi:hypothetical protein